MYKAFVMHHLCATPMLCCAEIEPRLCANVFGQDMLWPCRREIHAVTFED